MQTPAETESGTDTEVAPEATTGKKGRLTSRTKSLTKPLTKSPAQSPVKRTKSRKTDAAETADTAGDKAGDDKAGEAAAAPAGDGKVVTILSGRAKAVKARLKSKDEKAKGEKAGNRAKRKKTGR